MARRASGKAKGEKSVFPLTPVARQGDGQGFPNPVAGAGFSDSFRVWRGFGEVYGIWRFLVRPCKTASGLRVV